jgi:hypothetical protein
MRFFVTLVSLSLSLSQRMFYNREYGILHIHRSENKKFSTTVFESLVQSQISGISSVESLLLPHIYLQISISNFLISKQLWIQNAKKALTTIGYCLYFTYIFLHSIQ